MATLLGHNPRTPVTHATDGSHLSLAPHIPTAAPFALPLADANATGRLRRSKPPNTTYTTRLCTSERATSLADFVLGLHVGAAVQQQGHHITVAFYGGRNQRSVTMLQCPQLGSKW